MTSTVVDPVLAFAPAKANPRGIFRLRTKGLAFSK